MLALVDEDRTDIRRLDAALFGADRSAFIDAWLSAPGVQAVVIRSESQRVRALAAIRPALDGYKFGPVLAESPNLGTHGWCKATNGPVKSTNGPRKAGGIIDETLLFDGIGLLCRFD